MNGTKKFWQSKGVMGGLIAALGGGGGIAPLLALALGLMGYQVSGAEATELLQGLETIIASVGGILAVWGRITATEKVK